MTCVNKNEKANLRFVLQRLIAQLDNCLNAQVNCVLHHPDFQALESRWRGLALLTNTAHKNKQVKIRMLSVSYEAANQDVINAPDIEQSQLFRKIYSDEFDHPGGEPYGLLIGDYFISHKTVSGARDGIEFLRYMARITSSCFVPFVTSIDASFLGLNNFSEFKHTHKLADLFNSQAYQRWQQLRHDEHAHFLGLTLPAILMRKPYNQNGIKLEHRFFKEVCVKHKDYLWGNACFAYATSVIQSYLDSGWFTQMRGVKTKNYHGGQVNVIRNQLSLLPNAKLFSTISTETLVLDAQEKQFSEYGFIALRDHLLEERSVFYSSQSVKQPKKFTHNQKTVNHKLNAMLHYVLCASRFAHYIKVIMRDKLGAFTTAEECEYFISQWLNNYCAATQGQSIEALAKQPLQAAQVIVKSLPGRVGHYVCEMNISPHSQFDDMQSQLTLVTKVKLG
jgi:type VI secretion system protein ImpD